MKQTFILSCSKRNIGGLFQVRSVNLTTFSRKLAELLVFFLSVLFYRCHCNRGPNKEYTGTERNGKT